MSLSALPSTVPTGAAPDFSGSRITTLSLTGEGVFVGGRNMPDGLDAGNFTKALVSFRLSSISQRTFGDVVRTVGKVGGVAREQCEIVTDGFAATYDAELWRQEDGSVGVLLVDVTGGKRDSASVQALSLELAHRTKNVLAIVLSLATQTGRRMPDYEQFKERFFGQVDALSSAHDMIAASGWQGVSVAEIVKSTAVPEIETAVSIAPGAAEIVLNPNAVQNLSIILRELQTTCGGDAVSTCDIAETADGALDLTWVCEGGGDGGELWSDMLCSHAPTSLEGEGALDVNDRGYRYRLKVGAGQRV